MIDDWLNCDIPNHNIFTILFRGQYNANFVSLVSTDTALVNLLKNFTQQTWMINSDSEYLIANAARELGRLKMPQYGNAIQATVDAGLNTIFSSLNYKTTNPIMSSTGVIGNPLPKQKIIDGANNFDLSAKCGENLAHAIMTTDAYPKTSLYEVKLEDGSSFKIGSVAKGAGMINPNLATMLCFICTDAAAPYADIMEALKVNSETTFNAISVDGDTSTNDTVMVLANGNSKAYDKEAFAEVLRLVMFDMAMLMVADGEGANKVAAFEVINAATNEQAMIAAKALSNSLLVKTALFGEDPNFGRIASTIGASRIDCDDEKLVISYNDVVVFNKGEICFDANTESQAGEVLKKDKYKIICDIGLGDGKFTAYGCDLGYEYVKINADYRS